MYIRAKSWCALSRRSFLVGCTLLAWVGVVAAQSAPIPNIVPAAKVNSVAPRTFDLRNVGFEPLPNSAMLSLGSYFSLDFLDGDHLLVTFKKPGLVKRLRTCPATHSDHIVRALVYQISTGAVIKQTEWYLHDGRRYLWPLGRGRFLLRKADQLYSLDRELNEKILFDSPQELSWVEVTPDGKQIILESAKEGGGKGKRAKAFVIKFLNAETLSPQREVETKQLVRLQATSTGYGDLVHGSTGNLWLVRFGPDAKNRNYVARVKSPCTPTLLFPTANTLFIGRCVSLDAYSVSMFTVTGTRLWRQRWDDLRDVPSVSRTEDGSRFAISTVHHLPPKPAARSNDDDEEDPQASLEQIVDVFETASGNRVTSVKVSPVFVAGQNFALSPDSTQLALLRGSAVEVQRFAPASEEETAKYLAVKADVPGLYAPSEEEEDESADADEMVLSQSELAAADAAGSGDAVPAGQQAVAETPAATFRARSMAVVVDVVVLDSKNSPVQGLRPGDFVIKEDGVPQRVRYFDDHKPADKTPPTAPVTRPPNVFTNATQNPGTDSVTVILYDLLNTPPSYQPYALAQLGDYLKSKPSDVRAALFTLTTSLRMITGFTEDETTLLAAAQNKKNRLSGSLIGRQNSGPVGYDRVVEGFRQQFAQSRDDGGVLTQVLREQQQQQDQQEQAEIEMRVQTTLDAFAQLARYLSSIPGRKNLIWLSSSFPIWISPNPDSDHPFALSRNYGNQIKKAVNLLAAAHVAVYPINVQGLSVGAAFDVSAAGAPTNEDYGESNIATSDRATMSQIAIGTGGKAFTNTNGIKDAIKESVDQASSYYTLSYTSTNGKYDGKFRKIRVDAVQRGYKLQYRTGYYADDPEKLGNSSQELARELQLAAIQPGAPSLRQIPFVARVVPVGPSFKADAAQFMPPTAKKKAPAKKEERTVAAQHYAVDYAIPAARLRFVPMPDGTLRGVFNFMLTAFDIGGSVVGHAGNAANSSIPAESYKELLAAGYRMHQEIDVPTSATALRMAVQDANSGNLATLEVALPVPTPPDLPKRKGRKSLPEVEPD